MLARKPPAGIGEHSRVQGIVRQKYVSPRPNIPAPRACARSERPLRRRGVAADEVAAQVAGDHQTRACLGTVWAAPFVGGMGSLDEPAAALLLDRPAFERVSASAVVVHGSILRCKHERQDTQRLRRVGGIVRTEFEGGIVVIDFPEELIAREIEAAEVMFAVRIVVGAEVVERGDLSDRHRADVARQGRNACSAYRSSEPGIEGLSKGVVEFANVFARLVVNERHVLLHEVDVP
jgi:hypothetical protein